MQTIDKQNQPIRNEQKKGIPFAESRRGWFIFFIVAILLVSTPFILWVLQPHHKLHVWIYDKTVPTQEYREHRGVMWTLNHFRITNKVDQYRYFKNNRDYFGFFPLTEKDYEMKDLVGANPDPDLILLADTYGVYTDDYWVPNKKGNRSKLIYGGLTWEDLFMIKKNLRDHNTIMASFNTIATPTEVPVRKNAEKILGVEWREWMGRFFIDLEREKEVAVWMVSNWEEQHDAIWEFKGPGFVLCSNWDQVEVMVEGEHFNKEDIWFEFLPPYQEEFSIHSKISYYYWFDFVTPLPDTQTIAEYTMDVTPKGQELLDSLGLDSKFPAITRKITPDYTSYYLAGDFEDHKASSLLWPIYGLASVRKVFCLDFRGESQEYYWKGYVPFMKKVVQDVVRERESYVSKSIDNTRTLVENELHFVSRTQGTKLQVYNDNQWDDFFVKGINIGTALPGHWFTEFPKDEDIYYNWFTQISAMNVNTIRIYTLLDPAFYRALYVYNIDHVSKPLYLLQGIWPEEHPVGGDYWADEYNQSFQKELHWGVDAIHGNTVIPERSGRAWGRYIANVSPWTIAYLVGRELEAMEVTANDSLNKGKLYEGEYISVKPDASPTEAWLAWSCDQVALYEVQKYQWQRPVSIVSWPTLDITEHESEWSEKGDKSNQFNDLETVDIRNFVVSKNWKAGFFGTYHIYPNYPDFMNNESLYHSYQDSQGVFTYGGYLKEFFETHTGYPALVGEFGMANGMGIAHENPIGLHHGGMTETQQGEMIIRMMKAIREEKYAGGCIFEWMDEWAKKTWTTESFMIPYEHHVYWHNIIDPEQNYGILANETEKPKESDLVVKDTEGTIQKMEVFHDASYVYIDFAFTHRLDLDSLLMDIGIDTYDPARGSFKFAPQDAFRSSVGMEFLVQLSKDTPQLVVNPSYNIGALKFSSQTDYSGLYSIINPIINKKITTKTGRVIPEIRENGSKLVYGKFDESHANFYIEDGVNLHIRLPWGRLNVTDPTGKMVLDDPKSYNYYPDRDTFVTTQTKGFHINAVVRNAQGEIEDIFPGNMSLDKKEVSWKTIPIFTWKDWTWETPSYVQRLKKSYPLLQKYFAD